MRKWVRHLFDTIPFREIANGTTFHIQKAIHMRGERTVYPFNKVVTGTRIPVPTLRRISTGKAKLTKATAAKLKSFRTRYYYNALRAAGANVSTAKTYSQLVGDPELAQDVINDYATWAQEYSERYGVPYEAFVWGMSESDMDREDWEEYERED